MELNLVRSTPPEASEYAPYYGGYIAAVAPGDILDTLAQQSAAAEALFAPLTQAQAAHRYAPGKWSVKEVLGHINDGERVFSYRALRISRADRLPLASFNQDAFVAAAGFDSMPLAALADEFVTLRRATLALLKPLTAEAWLRQGIVNQNEVSTRALAWMIAGHAEHHFQILRERYLS
jgi:hypothetical protein